MTPLERNQSSNSARPALSAWMEPAPLIEQLARAQRCVAEAKRHIDRQRDVIARLKSGKGDTRTAEALLRTFETSHAQLLSAASGLRESLGRELSRAR